MTQIFLVSTKVNEGISKVKLSCNNYNNNNIIIFRYSFYIVINFTHVNVIQNVNISLDYDKFYALITNNILL